MRPLLPIAHQICGNETALTKRTGARGEDLEKLTSYLAALRQGVEAVGTINEVSPDLLSGRDPLWGINLPLFETTSSGNSRIYTLTRGEPVNLRLRHVLNDGDVISRGVTLIQGDQRLTVHIQQSPGAQPDSALWEDLTRGEIEQLLRKGRIVFVAGQHATAPGSLRGTWFRAETAETIHGPKQVIQGSAFVTEWSGLLALKGQGAEATDTLFLGRYSASNKQTHGEVTGWQLAAEGDDVKIVDSVTNHQVVQNRTMRLMAELSVF